MKFRLWLFHLYYYTVWTTLNLKLILDSRVPKRAGVDKLFLVLSVPLQKFEFLWLSKLGKLETVGNFALFYRKFDPLLKRLIFRTHWSKTRPRKRHLHQFTARTRCARKMQSFRISVQSVLIGYMFTACISGPWRLFRTDDDYYLHLLLLLILRDRSWVGSDTSARSVFYRNQD